jgi:hypothetical protein
MDRSNQKLELGFNKSDGTTCNLIFTGVLTYRINNILYQNVVSRILDSGTDRGVGSDLDTIARWTCGAEDKLMISEENLVRHTARIQSGELRLFYVEPSWGAEIGVIAKAISEDTTSKRPRD